MPVVDNKDILLLIIHFQDHGIPHSRYRSPICFVYSIVLGPPGPRDYGPSQLGWNFPTVGSVVFSNTPACEPGELVFFPPSDFRIYLRVIQPTHTGLARELDISGMVRPETVYRAARLPGRT